MSVQPERGSPEIDGARRPTQVVDAMTEPDSDAMDAAAPLPNSTARTTSSVFLFANPTGPMGVDGGWGARSGAIADDLLSVLRRCVAEAGGRELDTTVDSFPAVLPTASAAVACAARMRDEMSALQTRGDVVSLSVGLHAGEPIRIEDGRFFGAAMWTAARLCGRAKPAQILVSDAVRRLLPSATAGVLTEAGIVTLKGLVEPLTVHEVPPGTTPPVVDDRTRIVSVLSVDQVGSTAIIDAAGDLGARALHAALLDVAREAVEDHHGVEFEYGGDGLGVRFESAIDAATAAVAMQQAAARHRRRFASSPGLRLRIAVVAGEGIPTDRASLGRLAAQAGALGKHATADRILLSDVAHELAEGRRLYEFHRLDDESRSVTLEWAPQFWEFTVPPPLISSSPFVGRAAELSRLHELWDEARTTRRQRFVIVDGDAGIGKSALTARFTEEIAGTGDECPAIFYGQCNPTAADGYAALAEALSGFVAASSRADLRRMAGEHAPVLSRVLPVLAGRLPGLPPAPALDPRAEPFAIANGVSALLDGVCAVAPAVLVLDNAQEASSGLLTVLRSVADLGAARPLLVLLLERAPDFGRSPLSAALGTRDGTTPPVHITLQGLPLTDISALIEHAFDVVPTTDELRSISAESEGVPYFVLELARSRLRRDAEQTVRSSIERIEGWRLDIRAVQDQVAADVTRLRQLSDGEPRSDAQSPRLPIDPDGTPPISGTNPYRGLQAFDVDDADWFFGREQLTAELLAHVAVARVSAVIGASGSGKSSVVRAGLLPALAADALPGSARWRAAVLTPGADASAALAIALAPLIGSTPDATRRLLEQRGLGAVADLVAGDHRAGRLVIVIDQAEELFTETPERDRDAVVDMLLAGIAAGAPLSVIVVMRADFYGAWAAYPAMSAELERSHVLVGAMRDDEIRRAIERPAAKAGLVVEGSMTDAVVADITGESGALPLLSTALLETWHRRRGRSLTLTAYAETGGVRRAISRLADDAYASLTDLQRPIARRLLLRLARTAEQDHSIDVRRRARLSELAAVADDATAVLEVFVTRRLVRTDETTAEVAHEALLREWPLLRDWLAEDRRGRQVQQQLSDDSNAWAESGEDAELLYRGGRLAVASELVADRPDEINPSERAFLEAARRSAADDLLRARRTAARFRRLAMGLVVVLVVALVAGGAAVVQGAAADSASTTARAAALVSGSALLLDSQQDLGALLAAGAQSLRPSDDARSALVGAANRTPEITRITTLVSGTSSLTAVSADGSRAVAVSTAGSVTVLDVATRRTVGRFAQPVDSLVSPSLSPTGRYVALGAKNGSVRVLEVRSGRVLASVADPSTVTFVTDALFAFVDAKTLHAHYVELPSGHERILPGPTRGGPMIGSVDGGVLAWGDSQQIPLAGGGKTFGVGQTAHLVDLVTGRAIGSTLTGDLLGINGDGSLVALLRAGKLVVVRARDGVTTATSSVGPNLDESIPWQAAGATAVFDAQSQRVAFDGDEAGNPVHIVHLDTQDASQTVVPVVHAQHPPVFARTNDHLLAMGARAVVDLARTAAWRAPGSSYRFARYEGGATRPFVAADPRSGRVLEVEESTTSTTLITRYRLLSDRTSRAVTLEPPTGTVFDSHTATFSTDGRMVATLELIGSHNSGVVSVWETATGREIARSGPVPVVLPTYTLSLNTLAFLPRSTRVAMVTTPADPTIGRAADSTVVHPRLQVWDWLRNRRVLDAAVGDVNAVTFSPDGTRVATVGPAGLQVRDTGSGRLVASAPAPGWPSTRVVAMSYSTDGRFITMGSGGIALRWSAAAPKRPHKVVLGDLPHDFSWAVSPDASIVASLGTEGIDVHDLGTGKLLRTIAAGAGAAQVMGFSPDGDMLVTFDASLYHAIDMHTGTGVVLGSAHPIAATGEGRGDVNSDDPGAAFTRDSVFVQTTTGHEEQTDRFALSTRAALDRACHVAGRDLTDAEWSKYVPGASYRAVCAR